MRIRDIVGIMLKAGYQLIRHTGGSHRVYRRGDTTVVISWADRYTPQRGEIRKIERQSGLTFT